MLNSAPDRLVFHKGSRVVLYSEEDKLMSIDLSKDNNFEITSLQENLFALDKGGDNIFTIDLTDDSVVIVKVKIN